MTRDSTKPNQNFRWTEDGAIHFLKACEKLKRAGFIKKRGELPEDAVTVLLGQPGLQGLTRNNIRSKWANMQQFADIYKSYLKNPDDESLERKIRKYPRKYKALLQHIYPGRDEHYFLDILFFDDGPPLDDDDHENISAAVEHHVQVEDERPPVDDYDHGSISSAGEHHVQVEDNVLEDERPLVDDDDHESILAAAEHHVQVEENILQDVASSEPQPLVRQEEQESLLPQQLEVMVPTDDHVGLPEPPEPLQHKGIVPPPSVQDNAPHDAQSSKKRKQHPTEQEEEERRSGAVDGTGIASNDETMTVQRKGTWSLTSLQVTCGNVDVPNATVKMVLANGQEKIARSDGKGPIDAAYKAVKQIIQIPNIVREYETSVTCGIDAITTTRVVVEVTADASNNAAIHALTGKSFSGSGESGDIFMSAVIAYLNALNQVCSLVSDNEMHDLKKERTRLEEENTRLKEENTSLMKEKEIAWAWYKDTCRATAHLKNNILSAPEYVRGPPAPVGNLL